MITSDRELQAALDWLAYWKHNRSGEQSWIGNEQARQKMVQLRAQIDDYRKRTGVVGPSNASVTAQSGPEASTHTVNRVAEPDLGGR